MISVFVLLHFADTICGYPGAATTAVTGGPVGLAAGTYANFDHIVIPGGKKYPTYLN